MEIFNKKIDELIPYENNPRINDNAVKYVAESINQFGFKVPIVIDSNNVIIAGHTRLKASKKLKLKEVPCIIADDLTEEQIKKFRIADNKVSEFSEWDEELLALELSELEDMEKFGLEKMENKQIEEEEDENKPEIEFTTELLEEHNYLIFTFKDSLDWLKIKQFFGIKTVKTLDSKDNYERKGVGRVLNGDKLSKLIDEVLDV